MLWGPGPRTTLRENLQNILLSPLPARGPGARVLWGPGARVLGKDGGGAQGKDGGGGAQGQPTVVPTGRVRGIS